MVRSFSSLCFESEWSKAFILCKLLKINKEQTISIGNDFNDLDLLAFTQHSFLTENAPPEIKNLHKKAPSNENDAFAQTVQILFE
ncbi:MAG: HAD hydrolase family protein [Prolixibacteraceae bacterium]|nr:HAD hydrolase family protein [Prolixibacteraceae bacterium]